ncbi:methyltransferase domain-containing protein [Limnoglobus roseus]|uniref:Methyltransferase n=1 Tax=Limnoglobus roseus TaxID=2598579 RepID=A0A5C1ACT9_9BACT|nr:methyltransferase domain-containing protein [Limnoglobus roseus]QEL16023.1 methyltransferase [Limnoglobus roseus]
MSAWDPQLYLTFSSERTQPSVDLAARVQVAEPRRVIDLGCGPGNSTAVLKARWPSAAVTGLDSDPEMLATAAQADPTTHWLQADAATWQPDETYDVVFSNAMLQWLPGHADAVTRFFRAVAPGGALAVQVPTHQFSPLHRHIVEVASDPKWPTSLRGVRNAIHGHDVGFYYDLLSPLVERVDLWETEYCHVLAGPEAILTWIRGTGLRPFLNALPTDADRREFEADLLAKVTTSYPRRPDGRVLFPFRRLFFIGYRDR